MNLFPVSFVFMKYILIEFLTQNYVIEELLLFIKQFLVLYRVYLRMFRIMCKDRGCMTD